MPKSKPNKVVHLTQVKKKGKDHKQDLLRQLEEYGEKFERVYLFDFEQTKSDRIMLLRTRLKEHGRIFSGKNSLVSLALRNLGSKSHTNYDDLIKQVSGHRGLLFTDLAADELIDLLTDELPEFRARLLGCADLKRPAIARSDDDEDDDEGDQDDAEIYSQEDTSDERDEQDSDDKDDGEDPNDDDDGDVEMTCSAKTNKSRGKDAAAGRHRGMARVGDRYAGKQREENKRKDERKRQMRLKIESRKRQMRMAGEKAKTASGSIVSDPASEPVGKSSDKKKKKKPMKSRRASAGETVAPAGNAAEADVAAEAAEVSRKKSGKQKGERHEVKFESLR